MKVTITSTKEEFSFAFHNPNGDIVVINYSNLDPCGKEIVHDAWDHGILRLVKYLKSK